MDSDTNLSQSKPHSLPPAGLAGATGLPDAGGLPVIVSSRGTSIEQIKGGQRAFFEAHKTRTLAFREQKLRLLGEAIKQREASLLDALRDDLGKNPSEAFLTEVGFIYHDIKVARTQLTKWAQPQKVRSNLLVAPGRSQIISNPLGQILIIGPWNYPIQLLLSPLIGAIAAGNTAVIKPSEMVPHTSRVLTEMFADTFPEEYLAVFPGGPEVSQHLLRYSWDHVFFTGSTRVGRLVAEATGKSFSPCTLELGGKSPCLVDRDAKIALSAKRIVWGKFTNAGQTCVAPDFLWVHSKVKDQLVGALKSEIIKRYGNSPKDSPAFGRMVSVVHCQRLAKLATNGRLLYGGTCDPAARYMAPTLIDQVTFDDDVMKEEIFGPVLPILTFDDIDEVFSRLKNRDKPLALYYFGANESTMERIRQEVSFGGGCFNDVVMHLANEALPFGGIGASGQGAYHGRFSFDLFSHRKAMLSQTTLVDMPVRYPPYRTWQKRILRWLMT